MHLSTVKIPVNFGLNLPWPPVWFLPEASFGLWVLLLPACVCACLSVCVCVCVCLWVGRSSVCPTVGSSVVLSEDQLYWRHSTGIDGNYRSRKITTRRWLHKCVGAECGASSFTWCLYQICYTDVHPSVHPSIRTSVCWFVCQSRYRRRNNSSPVQARITKFGVQVQNTLVKVRGVIDLDLQGQI